MKRISPEVRKTNMAIISQNIRKYWFMLLIFSLAIIGYAIFDVIYWNYDENSAGLLLDNLYLITHIAFLIVSVCMVGIIISNRTGVIKTDYLAIIFHIYGFVTIALSTLLCLMDLYIGITPIVYILAILAIGGLFTLEPKFFTSVVSVSFVTVLIFNAVYHYDFFKGDFMVENIMSFIAFNVVAVLVSFRQFNVTIKEYKYANKLEHLSYYDELTGLLNERSYVNTVEEINEQIKNNSLEGFAVVLMDVNNLKATNDQYGHRYGCSLVVKCGHTLPTIFSSSKLFHVGGDEFIAIVMGEDYQNFEKTMQKFDELMIYSIYPYEGKDLIFSVARGYSKYQKGDLFKDVLQRADSMMYEHKNMIKEKYNLKGR